MENTNILYVLLAFGLFLLFVLVPIIPAALLYKWFPDSRVSAKGVLSKLTINSSGAFAAYIITVLLGYFVIADINKTILDLAKMPPSAVWRVSGNLQLQDKQGNRIDQAALFKRVSFGFKPDFINQENGQMELQLPEQKAGKIPRYFITVNVDGFGQATICPATLVDDDEARVGFMNHLITLNKPIIVRTINDPKQLYSGGEYINK